MKNRITLSFIVEKIILDKIKQIVSENSIYASQSHFIRIAIENEIKRNEVKK